MRENGIQLLSRVLSGVCLKTNRPSCIWLFENVLKRLKIVVVQLWHHFYFTMKTSDERIPSICSSCVSLGLIWTFMTPNLLYFFNLLMFLDFLWFYLTKRRQTATHSSRIRMTSALFSKTSCSAMTFGCWISFRMFTSRSMSSRVTPRRLDLLRRFLMNLAANSTPVVLCLHLLTTANWPLQTGGNTESAQQTL